MLKANNNTVNGKAVVIGRANENMVNGETLTINYTRK
jgi:hypothetical protein